LHIENRGAMNKFAQLLLKKPRVSHIHLDEMGSYVWLLFDGEKDITLIGVFVKEHFGDKAEPLYERLLLYIRTLVRNKFIVLE
jgi:hypothetical protein